MVRLPALVGAAMLAGVSAARADWPNPKIIMQCVPRENRILLRFGTLDAQDLPAHAPVTLEIPRDIDPVANG